MSVKKKVQFDKASATSKVRLERIKKIYEDCGWKRGDLSARERWIVKKIAIKTSRLWLCKLPKKEG